jgi:Indole-3-glycerol phosphate synthase
VGLSHAARIAAVPVCSRTSCSHLAGRALDRGKASLGAENASNIAVAPSMPVARMSCTTCPCTRCCRCIFSQRQIMRHTMAWHTCQVALLSGVAVCTAALLPIPSAHPSAQLAANTSDARRGCQFKDYPQVERGEVAIRRRPPRGIDRQACGPVDFKVEVDEDNTPRNILEEIVWHKATEIERWRAKMPLGTLRGAALNAPKARDFRGAIVSKLEGTGVPGLIAEVKKASPSRGVIQEKFDPVAIARGYEAGGSACLSVLTDAKYFQGGFENLKAIRAAGVQCPLLCKEFIVDAYQIMKARAARRCASELHAFVVLWLGRLTCWQRASQAQQTRLQDSIAASCAACLQGGHMACALLERTLRALRCSYAANPSCSVRDPSLSAGKGIRRRCHLVDRRSAAQQRSGVLYQSCERDGHGVPGRGAQRGGAGARAQGAKHREAHPRHQ